MTACSLKSAPATEVLRIRPAPDEAQLSRVPRGCWRNRWRLIKPVLVEDPSGVSNWVRPGEFLSSFLWPSREVAEEKAAQALREGHPSVRHARYLGPIFFPEDGQ